MAARKFPVVLATRVTRKQRALVDALAVQEDTNVTRLLRDIIVSAVEQRMADITRPPKRTAAF